MPALPSVRSIAAAVLVLIVTAAVGVAWFGMTHGASRYPTPNPSRPATRTSTPPPPAPARRASSPPRIDPRRPVAAGPDVLGWAIADVATGTILAEHGGGTTNPSASVVKAWLAADAMNRAGNNPDLAHDAQAALVDSDNDAATRLYRADGADRGLWRMIYTCRLYATLPVRQEWGATLISATDVAKLGACVANGTAAGPTWTRWILDRMHTVRGTGRFGAVNVLPGADIAIKNGWIVNNGNWIVNCLTIVDNRWSIGVITRYPEPLGLDHGAALCAHVATSVSTIAGPLGYTPPGIAA